MNANRYFMHQHARYRLVRYLAAFQAIQTLYSIHRHEQIAAFYASIDPLSWYMA